MPMGTSGAVAVDSPPFGGLFHGQQLRRSMALILGWLTLVLAVPGDLLTAIQLWNYFTKRRPKRTQVETSLSLRMPGIDFRYSKKSQDIS